MTIQPEIIAQIKKDVTPITFVWAQDAKGGIGYNGDLPWRLPADMKFFKEVTWGGVVVMGRKTYESIPNPPLKNRINLVLTNNKTYQAPGALVFNDSETLLEKALTYQLPVHIIGGSSLFSIYQDQANVLFCTKIDEEFQTDVSMPKMNWENFIKVKTEKGIRNQENPYEYFFETYIKKDVYQKEKREIK